PDPTHHRFVLQPYAPGASAERITKSHIQVTEQARFDPGLGHWVLLHPIGALLRIQHGNWPIFFKNGNHAFDSIVVRSLSLPYTVEAIGVAGDRQAVARRHPDI